MIKKNGNIPFFFYNYNYIYKNGYIKVTKNGKYGLLDNTGKEIIPCIYNSKPISILENGYIKVEKTGLDKKHSFPKFADFYFTYNRNFSFIFFKFF